MTREPFNPDRIQVPAQDRLPLGAGGSPLAERPVSETASGPRLPAGPMTVSQVTALVKQAVELALPPTLHVVGELSNFKRHTSGHLYFTLKDAFSELSCVMWRSSAASVRFTPADGMEVIATGSVEVFERAGRYQLYVRRLEPRGVGALELAFRQLCEKLAKEGLFDRERKRPLPRYPRRLAIVTSPTGAAIADMLRTIERRYPCVEVFLYPVRVQGAEAAGEIAAAIRGLNANRVALGGMDLMIVGRGGGSLEDLWAFNEEVVARAIFASRIPVISAVGHEVDVTIADLVADVRAATPTAAAEMAVPVLDELLADLAAHELRLLRAAGGRVQILSARLEGIGQRRSLREPMELVRRREQFLDERSARLVRLVVERLAGRRRRLDWLEPIVQRIAPHRLLRQRALSVRDFEHRLDRAMARRLADSERSVLRREEPMHQFSPANLVPRARERAERMAGLLSTSVRHRLTLYGEWLRRQDDLLQAMSYRSVLGRGFSITRAKKGRAVVRSTRELTDGQRLVTEVADGQFESQVVNLRQQELFE